MSQQNIIQQRRRSSVHAFKESKDLQNSELDFDKYAQMTQQLSKEKLVEFIKAEAQREYTQLQENISELKKDRSNLDTYLSKFSVTRNTLIEQAKAIVKTQNDLKVQT